MREEADKQQNAISECTQEKQRKPVTGKRQPLSKLVIFSQTVQVMSTFNNKTSCTRDKLPRETYSTLNSFSLTGRQKTNCMADQMRWNSVMSSILITPLSGCSAPYQTGESRNDFIFVRTISNMERPQHKRSLVRRSPNARNKITGMI